MENKIRLLDLPKYFLEIYTFTNILNFKYGDNPKKINKYFIIEV